MPSTTHRFCFVLGVIAAWPAMADSAGAMGGRTQVVALSFTLENPAARPLRDARFSVYGPLKRTATQELIAIDANYPFDTETDRLGNQILVFHFPSVQPFATKVLSIRAKLTKFGRPRPIEASVPMQEFLAPEQYIEADAPDIQDTAAQLRRSDPSATAKEIQRWVGGHILESGYIAEDLGALAALKTRRGDCTENAYLFAALARANRIPARVLGGFAVEAGRNPRMSEYHNWAEFNIDGVWRIADPQKKVFDAQRDSYVAFRIVSTRVANSLGDAHRYSASDGLVVREQQ